MQAVNPQYTQAGTPIKQQFVCHERTKDKTCTAKTRLYTNIPTKEAQLSQRDRAAGCVIVFAQSKTGTGSSRSLNERCVRNSRW